MKGDEDKEEEPTELSPLLGAGEPHTRAHTHVTHVVSSLEYDDIDDEDPQAKITADDQELADPHEQLDELDPMGKPLQ